MVFAGPRKTSGRVQNAAPSICMTLNGEIVLPSMKISAMVVPSRKTASDPIPIYFWFSLSKQVEILHNEFYNTPDELLRTLVTTSGRLTVPSRV
jgi:hypothetical protein